MYCFIFFLLSSLCIIGMFTEAMNCFSPPAKVALPGVGGHQNVQRALSLTLHLRGAGQQSLTGSTITGDRMSNIPKTGVMPTTPAICTCLQGIRQGSGYSPDTVPMIDRERWIQREMDTESSTSSAD